MTIDEAIEHCIEIANKKYADPNDEELDRCIECANQHEQLKEWLEELKILRKANEWIPVEERLPDMPMYEDSYIVQENDVVQPYTAYWNGEYWTDDWNNKLKGIIAWQPLPKPYKGEMRNDSRKDV